MTNAEAIAKFKGIMMAELDRIPSHYDAEAEGEVYSDTDKVDEILKLNKVVCEALEKQIPKKPIELTCPRCGFDRIDYSWWVFAYCPDCGQAIDWSEEHSPE